MESRFQIDAKGNWYNETELAWRMNEYDEYAVEQAVQLREQIGPKAELTVVSIGPDRVREMIKKALAMGCDKGIHVKDENASTKDPVEIASYLTTVAKDQNFDVIFTGMQSQDRGSSQVGVLLAEQLGMAAVTTIVHFEWIDGTIALKRELEGGMKSIVRAKPPLLVTCQLGLNTPRYPTLPNIMKARKKELTTVELSDLEKADALINTELVYFPEKKGDVMLLEGDTNQMADQLLGILRKKTQALN